MLAIQWVVNLSSKSHRPKGFARGSADADCPFCEPSEYDRNLRTGEPQPWWRPPHFHQAAGFAHHVKAKHPDQYDAWRARPAAERYFTTPTADAEDRAA